MPLDTQAFVSRVERACDLRGLKFSDVERVNSWSPGLIRTRWLKQQSTPGADKINDLADTLGVSTDYLLGREELDELSMNIAENVQHDMSTANTHPERIKKDDSNVQSFNSDAFSLVEALTDDTCSGYLVWNTLTETKGPLRASDVKSLFRPKFFDKCAAYYCEYEDSSFVLTAEWQCKSHRGFYSAFEIKLFIAPRDMSPIQYDDNKAALLQLLEYVSRELYDRLIRIEADIVRANYIRGFHSRQRT